MPINQPMNIAIHSRYVCMKIVLVLLCHFTFPDLSLSVKAIFHNLHVEDTDFPKWFFRVIVIAIKLLFYKINELTPYVYTIS